MVKPADMSEVLKLITCAEGQDILLDLNYTGFMAELGKAAWQCWPSLTPEADARDSKLATELVV